MNLTPRVMVVRMIVRDDAANLIGIRCDQCETVAPPAVEILWAHGLQNRGWYCSGGKHLCAEHHPGTPRDIGPPRPGETPIEYHVRTGLSV